MDIDGFGEEEGAFAEAFGVDHAVVAGDEDDADIGVAHLEEVGEGVAGEDGESDIEEDGVGGEFFEGLGGLLVVGGGADVVAVFEEEGGEGFGAAGVIVDD